MKKIFAVIIVVMAIYVLYSCVKDGSEFSQNVIQSHFEVMNIE